MPTSTRQSFLVFICAKQGLNLNQQNLQNKFLIQFGLIALLRPGAKLFVLKLKISFNKIKGLHAVPVLPFLQDCISISA